MQYKGIRPESGRRGVAACVRVSAECTIEAHACLRHEIVLRLLRLQVLPQLRVLVSGGRQLGLKLRHSRLEHLNAVSLQLQLSSKAEHLRLLRLEAHLPKESQDAQRSDWSMGSRAAMAICGRTRVRRAVDRSGRDAAPDGRFHEH